MWVVLVCLCGSFAASCFGVALEETALWGSLGEYRLLSTQKKSYFLSVARIIDSFFMHEPDRSFADLRSSWQACLRCSLHDFAAIEQLCESIATLLLYDNALKNSLSLSSEQSMQLRAIEEWSRSLVSALCETDSSFEPLARRIQEKKIALPRKWLRWSGVMAIGVVALFLLWCFQRPHSVCADSFPMAVQAYGLLGASVDTPPLRAPVEDGRQIFSLLPPEAIDRLKEEGLVVHAATTDSMVIDVPDEALKGKLIREASCVHLSSEDAACVRESYEQVQQAQAKKPLDSEGARALLKDDQRVIDFVAHVVGGAPDQMALSLKKILKNKGGVVAESSSKSSGKVNKNYPHAESVFLEELVAQCGDAIQLFIDNAGQDPFSIGGFMGARSDDEDVLSLVQFLSEEKDSLSAVFSLLKDDREEQQRFSRLMIQSFTEMIMQRSDGDALQAHKALIGALWARKTYAILLTKMHQRISSASHSTNNVAGGAS
ncbi:MAG: hypothetical protein QG604_33 [Candidatus Dependentiae bacterium]|nr:hypothetical protein [Candidatus Dependentiae bacterium]